MVDRLFMICAIGGGVLFCVRLTLFFIGGVADADGDIDADVDVDVDGGMEAASDVAFRVLSLQTITAFFMMFGLGGLALTREFRTSNASAILGATAFGAFGVYVVAKIIMLMKGLQSTGTIRIKNAVGQEGAIYLTIRAGGQGKVRVPVQGRLMVLNAISDTGEEIKTGDRVKVVKVGEDNMLVVTKLQSDKEGE